MCGIIGIINLLNNQNIYQLLLNGLYQLQNRGYDSAGIGLLSNEDFFIFKYASTDKIKALNKLESIKQNIKSNIGIGHNRWATHGGKTDNNSHPHISNCGNFILVHNGIIENYQILKNKLISNNYTFYSQTDTEVIVNLISYYYKKTNDTFKSINLTIKDLVGTYGLVIINKQEDNKLYCVRNGSPLLIGYNDEYAIISSEQSGFCNLVSTYITLNNDDITIIEKSDKIIMKTLHNYEINRTNNNNFDLTPSPFEHWTLKEIYEQSTTVLNAINNGGRIKNDYEVKLGGLDNKINELININNLILLGCGTSYYAGLYSLKFFKSLCNFYTVQIFDGADFNINDICKNGISCLVLISQSGETKDLHRCIKIAKDNNIITIGIINVVDSLIAREVDCGIYLNAGREMAVASTKAFTAQTVCLSLMSIWFSQIHSINHNKRYKIIKDLHNLSRDINNTIDKSIEYIKDISDEIIGLNSTSMFILGKGSDESIAKEGALKIKEISYIHAEGYSASSLKHGPFALLDEHLPVILLNCDIEHNNKVLNCYEEVKSRNAPIYLIKNRENNETYQSLLAVIPLQLLAYFLSIKKNIDPDTPKNLAKVVTVE